MGVGGNLRRHFNRRESEERQPVANFNTLFVLVQISIMVVFIFTVVQGLHKGEGVGTVWSLQPFISENAHLIPIITGATIVCFSFLGFDAVTTLSEETPDAARVIPKAIFLTAVYGGVIFIAASFFMQLFFPDISRFKDPDAALPEIALYVGGKLFQSIFLCTTFVNTLASGGLTCQRVTSAVCDGARQCVSGARVWLCASEMADSGTERHYGRDCRDVGAVLRFSYRHSVN